MNIRGMRDKYPGYEGMNIRGESINIRYDGMNIRGIRV